MLQIESTKEIQNNDDRCNNLTELLNYLVKLVYKLVKLRRTW